jgi:hypothetical protein
MEEAERVFTERLHEKMDLMLSFFFLLHLIVLFSDSSFQNRDFLDHGKKQDLLLCFLVHANFTRSLVFVPLYFTNKCGFTLLTAELVKYCLKAWTIILQQVQIFSKCTTKG